MRRSKRRVISCRPPTPRSPEQARERADEAQMMTWFRETDEAEQRLADALVLAIQAPDDDRADRAVELAEDIAAMLDPPAVQRAKAAAQAICGEPRHG